MVAVGVVAAGARFAYQVAQRVQLANAPTAQVEEQLAKELQERQLLEAQVRSFDTQFMQAEREKQALQSNLKSTNDRLATVQQEARNAQKRISELEEQKSRLSNQLDGLTQNIAATKDSSADRSGGIDDSTSRTLTRYLHHNGLPYVYALVTEDEAGNRRLFLTGPVRHGDGKTDSEAKAREFLNDPNATITNNVEVRPDLPNDF